VRKEGSGEQQIVVIALPKEKRKRNRFVILVVP
jgi:hypothetical protein